MRWLFLCFLALWSFSLLVAAPASAQIDPHLNARLQQAPIIVNKDSISLFDQIPANYLNRANQIHILFSDRSVGDNINTALDCLTAQSWATSAPGCRRDYYSRSGSTWLWKLYAQGDWDTGTVPQTIQFTPNPVLYDRSNVTYEFRGDSWHGLTQNFIEELISSYIDTKDVLTYQFSYLNISEGDTIDDPLNPTCHPNSPSLCGGFFVGLPDISGRYDISDIEAFQADHPNKVFIFWTTSLSRQTGSFDGQNFNQQVRQYVTGNHQILFDFADIEQHTATGQPCYDNRDGIEYCNQATGDCENYPNDNLNYAAICQDYTTELDGGHLGSVSGAKIRTAKAWWVLMAQLAGWNPSGTITPPPVSPTPLASPQPTGGGGSPDLDGDGDGDFLDLLQLILNFNSSGLGNFNLIGPIDIFDFNLLLQNL